MSMPRSFGNTRSRSMKSAASHGLQRKYTAAFIDFGYCFNAGEWSFPDSSLRGAYARQEVYAHMAYGAISNRGYRGSSDVLRRSCRVSPKTFQSNGTEIPTTWIVYWI